MRQIAAFLIFSVIALGAAMTFVTINQRLVIKENAGHQC
jgi:hypothetical protein